MLANEKVAGVTNLQEAAVALCVNGVCQSVMMATPSDLESFALGFALSEGLIASVVDVLNIDCLEQVNGWQADITVLAASEHNLKQRRRKMAGPSGCGLCGVTSLDAAMELPSQKETSFEIDSSVNFSLEAALIRSAVSQLPDLQKKYNSTRGHHSALFFGDHGQFIELSEDVGRHSALDKLIGRLALCEANPLNKNSGFALLTSRCSHDLVIKASRSGIPALVSLGLPTNLAVQSAQQLKLPLFCFHHDQIKQFA
jgi:FdhD protein